MTARIGSLLIPMHTCTKLGQHAPFVALLILILDVFLIVCSSYLMNVHVSKQLVHVFMDT